MCVRESAHLRQALKELPIGNTKLSWMSNQIICAQWGQAEEGQRVRKARMANAGLSVWATAHSDKGDKKALSSQDEASLLQAGRQVSQWAHKTFPGRHMAVVRYQV